MRKCVNAKQVCYAIVQQIYSLLSPGADFYGPNRERQWSSVAWLGFGSLRLVFRFEVLANDLVPVSFFPLIEITHFGRARRAVKYERTIITFDIFQRHWHMFPIPGSLISCFMFYVYDVCSRSRDFPMFMCNSQRNKAWNSCHVMSRIWPESNHLSLNKSYRKFIVQELRTQWKWRYAYAEDKWETQFCKILDRKGIPLRHGVVELDSSISPRSWRACNDELSAPSFVLFSAAAVNLGSSPKIEYIE